jgi:hypothetical protein
MRYWDTGIQENGTSIEARQGRELEAKRNLTFLCQGEPQARVGFPGSETGKERYLCS